MPRQLAVLVLFQYSNDELDARAVRLQHAGRQGHKRQPLGLEGGFLLGEGRLQRADVGADAGDFAVQERAVGGGVQEAREGERLALEVGG